MIRTRAYHALFYVSVFALSFRFYDRLFRFVGWKRLAKWKGIAAWSDGRFDVWIVQASRKNLQPKFNRKRVGINHLALTARRRSDIDLLARRFLRPRRISTLYGSPKMQPYRKVYYAVYFEDPDRMKIEVVYVRD